RREGGGAPQIPEAIADADRRDAQHVLPDVADDDLERVERLLPLGGGGAADRRHRRSAPRRTRQRARSILPATLRGSSGTTMTACGRAQGGRDAAAWVRSAPTSSAASLSTRAPMLAPFPPGSGSTAASRTSGWRRSTSAISAGFTSCPDTALKQSS